LFLPFVVVKVNSGDIELPRSTPLGYVEFFRALYSKYPAVGRPRSVFGGLWTDRTNAAAVLRGKLAVGQMSTEVSSIITGFINNGLATIKLNAVPDRKVWLENIAERLGETLDDKALLSPLRAILEDNPLAIRADWLSGIESELTQTSASNPSPSPAECLDIVVPFGNDVCLDVVRDGHRLPEFTPHGISRWVNRTSKTVLALAGDSGILDRHALPNGSAAIVGPGTLYRAHCAPRSAALRIQCLPERGAPLQVVTDPQRREVVRSSGVRILI
jgi:hypothetical protein